MTHNIIETDFQRGKTSVYQLSILVGMDSLVYSVYDDSSNLLALKSLPLSYEKGNASNWAESLDIAIGKEDLLSSPYHQVKILLTNTASSLVPERLFNQEEKNTYLDELSSTSNNKGDLLVNEIEPLKIRSVCQIDKELQITLKSNFPSASFYSAATSIVTGSLHCLPEGATETAFACFQGNSQHLALFDKGDLLFYNCFDVKSAGDVLYFTLLAFEQYGLDPAKTPLFLSGNIIPDSDIYKTLFRYIADLSFLPAPSFVHFGPSASNHEPNFFFPLHSLLLCR